MAVLWCVAVAAVLLLLLLLLVASFLPGTARQINSKRGCFDASESQTGSSSTAASSSEDSLPERRCVLLPLFRLLRLLLLPLLLLLCPGFLLRFGFSALTLSSATPLDAMCPRSRVRPPCNNRDMLRIEELFLKNSLVALHRLRRGSSKNPRLVSPMKALQSSIPLDRAGRCRQRPPEVLGPQGSEPADFARAVNCPIMRL